MTAKHCDKSMRDEIDNIEKKRKIAYEANEEDVTPSIVQIVTNHDRPFKLLDIEGFRDISSLIFSALQYSLIRLRNVIDHVMKK